MNTAKDHIKKEILLKAPVSRVWRALSDAEEFGEWFGAALKGKTFTPGSRVLGQMTASGCENIAFDVLIEDMEPNRLLSFWWHPYAVDPSIDYSKEPTTLVVFSLKEVEGGTLLSVIESGFDKISPSRTVEALHMHSGGWDEQLKNIEKYISTSQTNVQDHAG